MRKFSGAVDAFVALAFWLGSAARAADPYDIYVILALTGPLALIGNDDQTSLRIEERIINGRSARFVIQDDQSAPATAVQIAGGIMAKNVPTILAPTYAASCLAIAPLVRANAPIAYCLAPAIYPATASFMFSSSVSTFDQTVAMLNFAQSRGWKRVAALSTTDATGAEGETQLRAVLTLPQFSRMELVVIEHVALSDVSAAAPSRMPVWTRPR